ncbi:MAG TPA: RNA methyltransferase [Ignavibacteriaceae bacterium]|nr:RNA methyltransferase [Ignavibacteriaceae bacterium]
MKKLTHDEITINRQTLENLHKVVKLPVFVLLNSIRSNYNVGSIFRTSDGAMIEKLYLCGYTPHPPKPSEGKKSPAGKKEILKTALGSTKSVSWEYDKDPIDVIKKLKAEGIKICALELTTRSRKYYEVSKNDFPLCLIIGNEITGVAQELIDLCDFSIEIPQYGIKQSLNVAVAFGIAIFELRKIYDAKNQEPYPV